MKRVPYSYFFIILDSLCYWIPTEKDLYEEIKGCSDYMDFSNYAQDHPNYCSDNQLVPGKDFIAKIDNQSSQCKFAPFIFSIFRLF